MTGKFQDTKNVACLVKDDDFCWNSKNNVEWDWGRVHQLLLYALPSNKIELQEESSAEGSLFEWELLKQKIQEFMPLEYSSKNRSFMTLWATCDGRTDSTTKLSFKLNHQFAKTLVEVLKRFSLKIEGECTINQYTYDPFNGYTNSLDLDCVQFFFNSFPKEDFSGELIFEPEASSIINYALTKRENTVFRRNNSEIDHISLNFEWSISICWDNGFVPALKMEPVDLFGKMFDCEDSKKDLTIVTGDGFEAKCHKIIFAAHSPVLAAMITSDMIESNSGKVELLDISEIGIKILLPYFYGKELTVNDLNCEMAFELFQFAHKYNLAELEKQLEKLLLVREDTWFNANIILELHFFARNLEGHEDLKRRSLQVISGMPDEIKTCDRYKKLDDKEALELLWILFKAVV